MSGSRQRDFEETSEYFSNPELPTNMMDHGHKSQAKLSVHEGNKGTGSSLQSQFRDDRGNRRGLNGGNVSSDELDGETTVGLRSVMNKGSLPKSTLCRTSPKKLILFPEPPTEDSNSDLAPSSIKATDFIKRLEMVRRSSEQGQEKTADWSIDLVHVSIGQIRIDGPGLQLKLNKGDSSFFYITIRGKKISIRGSDLCIQPEKIRKIILERDGKKVRVETCKSDNLDTRIDMETCTERDATIFTNKLQEDTTIGSKFQEGLVFPGLFLEGY